MSLEFINWFEGIDWGILACYILFWAFLWGSVGAIVGDAYKRQATTGFLGCALLGPFGFLVLVSSEDRREKEFWERFERETERIEKRMIRNLERSLAEQSDALVARLCKQDLEPRGPSRE